MIYDAYGCFEVLRSKAISLFTFFFFLPFNTCISKSDNFCMDNEGTKLTTLSLIVLHMSYFISCTYAQGIILTTLYIIQLGHC